MGPWDSLQRWFTQDPNAPSGGGGGFMERLNDPRTMALLGAAQGLFKAGQPSQFPTGLGHALNAGVQGGVQGILSSQQAKLSGDLKRAELLKLKREAERDEENRLLRRRLFGDLGMQPGGATAPAMTPTTPATAGVLSSGATPATPRGILASPERLEQMGTYLALSGDPGATGLITVADRLRKREEDKLASDSFRSRPGILGAGVTTTSPQGQALLGNLTGDPSFDQAVLQAQNEALNSNPRLAPQGILAERPGLFAPLMSSQYVGPFAQSMQAQLDSTPGLPPAQWLSQYDRLQQQHLAGTNAAAARAEQGSLRRDLADQSLDLRRSLADQANDLRRDLFSQGDDTRRLIAGNALQDRQGARGVADDQRAFNRERALAREYNGLPPVKDFSIVLPVFDASAQYIAGGKYTSSGDRALAFNYARTLDPKDRVGVRDIQDINKLGNVPERIQQALEGLAQGKELPDRVRREMFDVMRQRFNSMNEQMQDIEDEYERRAMDNQLSPANVVKRYSVRGARPPGAQQSARPANAVRGRINFDDRGAGNESGGWSAREIR